MFALSGRKVLLGLALGILSVTFSIAACSSSSSGPPIGTYTTASGSFTLWELDVSEDLIIFKVAGQLIEEDDYSASNGQITLESIGGSRTCAGAATYEWSREGDSVTFTLVQDSCGERVEFLTLEPWTRQ